MAHVPSVTLDTLSAVPGIVANSIMVSRLGAGDGSFGVMTWFGPPQADSRWLPAALRGLAPGGC